MTPDPGRGMEGSGHRPVTASCTASPQDFSRRTTCFECGEEWPCEVSRLLATLDAARARAESAERERDEAVFFRQRAEEGLPGSYVPQDRAAECMAALKKAGAGGPGKSNCLANMVEEVCSRATAAEASLREAEALLGEAHPTLAPELWAKVHAFLSQRGGGEGREERAHV